MKMKGFRYLPIIFFTLLNFLFLIKFREEVQILFISFPSSYSMFQVFLATSDRVTIQNPSPIKDAQKDFHSTIIDEIFSNKAQSRKPKTVGLRLELVENENMTEINIFLTESNSSFSSLITVRIH